MKKQKFIYYFSAVLYCLSKQARKLGANKLAKQLLDRMQSLRIPQKFQEQVEIATIAARARPYSDPEELLPMCYRCSTYNPLASVSNRCVNCGEKFVHSYVSFGKKFDFCMFNFGLEILPLVEFVLQDGISDIEAVRLIETPIRDVGKEEISESQDTLQLDSDDEEKDPFAAKLDVLRNFQERFLFKLNFVLEWFRRRDFLSGYC